MPKPKSNLRRVVRVVLFPPFPLLLFLTPIAAALVVYSLWKLTPSHPLSPLSYLLSAYALTTWCVRLPALVRRLRGYKAKNRYLSRYGADVRLRMTLTLGGGLVWNGAYACLQLGLGIWHGSFWYLSLAGYYGCLAVMRFFLLRYIRRHDVGEDPESEGRLSRRLGWVFLSINLALSGMVLLMITDGRVTMHHEITTIAIAAYTFTSLTMAIVNALRYRRIGSAVVSCAKAVSLAAASVSMIPLTSTMLAVFSGAGEREVDRGLMLSLLGGAVAVLITALAFSMIVRKKPN